MDLLSLLRTLGGLGVVLGILAGALWLVRRYDLRLPGRAVTTRERRLELVETLPIDARRMIALVRRDGREHLVLIAPEGHLILENAIIPDATDEAAAAERRAARVEAALLRDEQRQQRLSEAPFAGAAGGSFAALINRVGTKMARRDAAPTGVLSGLGAACKASWAMIKSAIDAPTQILAKAATTDSIGVSPQTVPRLQSPSGSGARGSKCARARRRHLSQREKQSA